MSKEGQQRRAIEDRVSELKAMKRIFQSHIEHITKEAEKLANEAEAKGVLRFITQSNASGGRQRRRS